MSPRAKPELDKGGQAEEHLRAYFIAQGCFVVRGAKLRYAGFDVTDVDLYLYSRASLYTRERAVVDIKNKRTPQAMERVLWAKGIMEVLGFDRGFVATTDNRYELARFGAENDVVILNGEFLARLTALQAGQIGVRLTEDEFCRELETASVGKLGGDWKGLYEESKSRLLHLLSFDGLNSTFDDGRVALEAMATRDQTTVVALRFLYVLLAHAFLVYDYIARRLPQLEADERKGVLSDGLRYGDSGKERSQHLVSLAANLATAVGGRFKGFGPTIKEEFDRQNMQIPVEGLSEYFAKAATLKSAFDSACSFEREAFARNPTPVAGLSVDQKSIIGLLCDFYSIDRKLVM